MQQIHAYQKASEQQRLLGRARYRWRAATPGRPRKVPPASNSAWTVTREKGMRTRVVMGLYRYSCSGLFTIQIVPYIFLAQNYIKLKHGLFKARSLNNLGQNLRLFTTPHSDAFTKLNERKKKLSESSQWVFVCFLSAPFTRNSISSLKYNFSLFLLSS